LTCVAAPAHWLQRSHIHINAPIATSVSPSVEAARRLETMMTLVEMVNSNPQLARADLDTPRELPGTPAASAATLTTAGVAAGAVANASAIGRAID
jgi:hypothetical protein